MTSPAHGMLLIPDPDIPATRQKTTDRLFSVPAVTSQHSKRIAMPTFGKTVYGYRIQARS